MLGLSQIPDDCLLPLFEYTTAVTFTSTGNYYIHYKCTVCPYRHLVPLKTDTFLSQSALAGPRADRPDSMMAVNYRAPLAAARACEALEFGHWVQSSTQAVKAERAGQVPYSRWKAMADYSLARLEKLPVSVMTLGLLYCKHRYVLHFPHPASTFCRLSARNHRGHMARDTDTLFYPSQTQRRCWSKRRHA